jgi:Gpi18-like mannosyltransferase
MCQPTNHPKDFRFWIPKLIYRTKLKYPDGCSEKYLHNQNLFENFNVNMMLAVVSRAITLVGAVVSDWLVLDHKASGVEAFDFEYSSQFSKSILHAFVRWDSVHMMKIAGEGYRHEHQLVFFPLYPAIAQLASNLSTQILTRHEQLLVASLVLNFILFVMAHQILKRLLCQVFPAISALTLKTTLLLFCFNPAGVFFSVPYTESLFCCLSWLGFLLYTQGNDIMSTIPLCLASFVRSNGSLNIVVICCVWLGRSSNKQSDNPFLRA